MCAYTWQCQHSRGNISPTRQYRRNVTFADEPIPCLKPLGTFVSLYPLPCEPSNTFRQTVLAYARVWHHVDASERILGKLAERIAIILMGKHKPIYDPSGEATLLYKIVYTYLVP